MPGMDGMEAARRIRALGLADTPMLLMVTAYGREEVLKEAEGAGIQNVLVKPVNASALFDITMGALGGRQFQQDRPSTNDGAEADQRLAALRGARILLVEDNEINQQVARELLQDAGFVVDVAENGKVALDLVQASAYDLVFMDMQMPVMDGVTATRELRKLQGVGNVPVVAMTANAMEQDRRKCLDAGMNDFLVKPIEPKDMWTILVRWVRPRQASGNASNMQASAPSALSAGAARRDEDGIPIGIAGLDTALGLKRMLGKKPLYLSVLRRYVAGQEHLMRDIRQALAIGDLATAERLAHTSKGVSGSVGAVLVQDCSGAVESALRQGHALREVESLLASLEKTLDGLLAALQVHLGPA